MADEKDDQNKGDSDDAFKFPSESFETNSTGGDDDLGSLPPLSDFESADAGDSGDKDDAGGDFGSLPPLSDIDVNTPGSGGDGGPESTPPGFDSGNTFNTPASDGDLDTPAPGNLDTPQQAGQTAFQDLQADSDFSPETPEIGPGPDSDLETPMFDSAFGGGASELTPPPPSAMDTPTMAMDTPMFESSSSSTSGGDFGFDDGAFGGGGGAPAGGGFDAAGGTPVPDITDTGFPAGGATPAPTPFGGGDTGGATPAPVAAGGGGGGGTSRTALIIAAVVALIVGLAGGIFGGPMIMDGGSGDALAEKDQQITQLQGRVTSLQNQINSINPDDKGKNPQELQKTIEDLLAQTNTARSDLETATAAAEKAQADYESVLADLDDANNSFVAQQQELENLQNALSITRAQQEGLLAEITRFQDLVGELEEANARRLQTRDTLLTSIGRLEAIVNEGSPLTPAKYNRDDRIARVTDLKSRVENTTWVSAQLLSEYTSLYVDELQIAGSRDYFFAQIPVENKLGTIEMKWAECLMNGNWSVYFRTLDGKSVGIYQNTSAGGPASYEFRQFLDKAIEANVENEIFASRPADWAEKISVVAERELAADDRHQLQKWYDSL